MQYLGGKSRISKQISEVLNNALSWREEQNQQTDCNNFERHNEREREFVSLFCGSCAIESKVVASKKTLNDKHPYLISMWKALQSGWIPPDIITKDQYYHVKSNMDENPALTGFVGFGCSFGGKWFGGLASNKKGDNYCARANRSLLKDLDGVKDATFTCLDYQDVEIPDGSVVYCDPPYANTTGYTTGRFDSDAFWDYVRELSKRCTVFVSEEYAPDDFEVVWCKEQTRTLDFNKDNQFKRVEKLFKYKGND